ncbi:MAG: sodium:solute symporter family protein [Alphaproteobacteria bacterium]
MTETHIFILASLDIYFLAMIAIGYFASRKESANAYIIGNRDVGHFRTMGSLAANFRDGAGIVFWVGAGLTMGYGGLWMAYGAIVGLLFFSFAGPRIREIGLEKNYITIGQVIRDNIGLMTRKLTAVVIVVFTMMLVAMQLYVSGNVIARILHLEAWIGICSVAAVVGCYLYWGGYGNVIKTEGIQCILIVSLIAIPLFLPPTWEQVLDFGSSTSMGLKDSIAFFLIGLFYPVTCADAWQRVFSARDGKVIQYAFPASGVIFLVMTLSLIFLGFGAKHILSPGTEANDVFFALFEGNVISAALQSFIAIVAMAITMSTMSSGSYLTASTICKDILPEQTTTDSTRYIKLMRLLMPGILASMSIVAIGIGDVVQFLFNAASLLFLVAPIYVAAVLGKICSRKMDKMLAFFTTISIACYIYMFASGAFENLILIFVPTAMNIVFTLVVCSLCRNEEIFHAA